MAPTLSKRGGRGGGINNTGGRSLMEIGGQSAVAATCGCPSVAGMKAGTPPRGCQRKRGWCQGKWRKWQVPCRPPRCTDRAGTTGRGQATSREPGIGSRGENRARTIDGGKEGNCRDAAFAGGSQASAKIFLSGCKLWRSCSVLQPLRDHPRKMGGGEREVLANSCICGIWLFLVIV